MPRAGSAVMPRAGSAAMPRAGSVAMSPAYENGNFPGRSGSETLSLQNSLPLWFFSVVEIKSSLLELVNICKGYKIPE